VRWSSSAFHTHPFCEPKAAEDRSTPKPGGILHLAGIAADRIRFEAWNLMFH